MSNFEELIKSMSDDELRTWMMCFTSDKVISALKILNMYRGGARNQLLAPTLKEARRRGLLIPDVKE